MSCIVVIPIYKEFNLLSKKEINSLKQVCSVLSKHQLCLVMAMDFNFQPYLAYCKQFELEIKIEKFPVINFVSIGGYNKLLLSSFFYEQFAEFKYLLIYQLDAWVFTDQLQQWCNKNYDYIGAPWINENVFSWIGLFPFWMKWHYKIRYNRATMPLVGNGGLSLRNVKACLAILSKHQEAVAKWSCHEDLFWSFYTIYKEKWFSIPSTKEAVAFSFEFNPDAAFELNNHQLPFGCHAWEKYNPSFWRKYISA